MLSEDKVKEQLARINKTGGMNCANERKSLQYILNNNETILDLVTGTTSSKTPNKKDANKNGMLLLTDQRVIFVSQSLFGSRFTVDYSLENITSVRYESGMVLGDATIMSYNDGIRITNIPSGEGDAFCTKVRTWISKAKSETQASTTEIKKSVNDVENSISNNNTGAFQNTTSNVANQPVKKTPSTIITIITLIIVLGISSSIISCLSSAGDRAEQEAAKRDAARLSDDASKIKTATGLTDDQAKKISDVLKSCGVENIKTITADTGLDNTYDAGEKAFRIEMGLNIKNIMLYTAPNGTVYRVRWANKDFYQDGKAMLSMNDFLLTSDERANLQIACKEIVTKSLRSPKHADFPWTDWKFDKNPERIIVQSYVDGQNGFGADVRAKFQITFDTKTKKITSYILEGKKII